MSRKLIFFDIDGTLIDSNLHFPKSAEIAIKNLQANGHFVAICSGRTYAAIKPLCFNSIAFDGKVLGCGTLVEYKNQEIFYHKISEELAIKAVESMYKYNMFPILEGKNAVFFDDEKFNNEPDRTLLKKFYSNNLKSLKDNWGNWQASKISCSIINGVSDVESCRKEFEDVFDFMVHNDKVVETKPKGISKATGIEKLLEHFPVKKSDIICFGDSINDLDMLQFSNTAIVMGNGSDEAKKYADFVTKDINDNGILYALEQLRLI